MRRAVNPPQIHTCTFEVELGHVCAPIKFTCRLLVAWKTSTNRPLARTLNDNVQISNNVATFDQTLRVRLYMLYDTKTGKYLSKETSLNVLLISARKPGEEKLVGRVVVDLGAVLNEGQFGDWAQQRLQFCSMRDASLRVRMGVVERRVSGLAMGEVDLEETLEIGEIEEQGQEGQIQEKGQFIEEASIKKGLQVEEIQDQEKPSKQIEDQQPLQRQKQAQPAKIEQVEQVPQQLPAQQPQPQPQAQPQQQAQEQVQQPVPSHETPQQPQQTNPQQPPSTTSSPLLVQNQKLIQIIHQLTTKLSQQQQQSAHWQQKYQQLQSTHTQIQNQTKQIVQSLQRQLDDLSQKSLEYDGYRQMESELEEKMKYMRTKYRKKVGELEESEGRRLQAEAELMEVKFEMGELRGDMEGMKGEIEAMRGEMEAMSLRNRELSQELERRNQSAVQPTVSTADNSQSEATITALQQQLQAAEHQLIRYQTLRIQLQTSNAHIQQQIRLMQSKLQTSEQALAETNKQLQNTLGQIIKYKEINEETESKAKVDSQHREKQKREELAKLEKQMQRVRGQSQEQVKMHTAQVAKLNMQIQELSKKIQSLEKDNSIYREKIKKDSQLSESRHHDLQTKITQLLQQLKTKQSHLTTLNDKLSHQMLNSQQLQQRIAKFADKESKMRESISVLEQQSKKIYEIVMEKQQREEEQDLLLQEKITELERLQEQLYQRQLTLQATMDELNEQKRQVYELRKGMLSSRSSPGKEETNGYDTQSEELNRLQEINLLNLNRIEELERELVIVAGQKNKQIQGLLNKLSVLDSELQNYRQRARSLEQYLQDVKNKNNDLSGQIDNLMYSQRTIQSTSSLNQNLLNHRFDQLIKRSQAKQAQLQRIIEEKQQQIVTSKKLVENLKVENSTLMKKSQLASSIILDGKQEPAQLARIHQLEKENLMMQTQLSNQQARLSQVQGQLVQAQRTIALLRNQMEQKQVSEMSASLQKQFLNAGKQQSKSNSNSVINSGLNIASADLVQACKKLQQLLRQRMDRDKVESILEMMTVKNVMLENEMGMITEQRAAVQENARGLSMELQKIKAKILKGKGNFQQKNQLISSLRPCEAKVKDLVTLTQKLFDGQIDAQAY